MLEDAIAKLSALPQQVEDAIHGLTEEQISWKPTEFFSLRENILHLRDIDVFGYEKRLRAILTEDYPVLPNLDGAKLAIEREYHKQPVLPALEDLKRSRALSMQRLKGCSVTDLDRMAEMQGAGRVSVLELLELWMEHDRGHIADMLDLRRSIENGSGTLIKRHKVA